MESKNLIDHEREKYRRAWNLNDYRRYSPAFEELRGIRRWLDKHACKHVLTLGCGTGRMELALKADGYSVRMVDIAENCLDDRVRSALDNDLTFEVDCLWSPTVANMRADAVICVDVLEHIPPEHVETVIENIKNAAPHGYVNAATFKDAFGRRVGEPLHLTVKPAAWWHKHFPDAECSARGGDAWMIW